MSKKVATKEKEPIFKWRGAPADRNLDVNIPDDGLKAITGADSIKAGLTIIFQAAKQPCINFTQNGADGLNLAEKRLRELGLKDSLEGMLAAQMLQANVKWSPNFGQPAKV